LAGAIPEILPTFKPITNQGFLKKITIYFVILLLALRKSLLPLTFLTEVSNHCDKPKGKYRATYCESLIPLIKALKEETVEAATLCEREHFVDFGLADMAISEISSSAYLVLTIDFDLVGHLKKRKIDVINFNHMRLIANE